MADTAHPFVSIQHLDPASPFGLLMEHIREAVIAVDRAWSIRYLNQPAAALLNQTGEDSVGMNLWDMLERPPAAAANAALARAMQEKIPDEYEYLAPTLDSLLRVRLMPAADGLFLYLDRVPSGEREPSAAHQLASLVSASNDAIIGVSPEGRISSWNPGAEQLLGYSAKEIIGHDASQLIFPQAALPPRDLIARALDGTASRKEQGMWRKKDGTPIPVSISATPLHGADQTVIGVTTTAARSAESENERFALLELRVSQMQDDLTEHRRAQAQSREVQDELEIRVAERTRELEVMVEERRQLLAQLVDAEEQERHRITREMHDRLGQFLTALSLGLKALHAQDGIDPQIEQRIEKLQALTKLTSEAVQTLVYELRPVALEDLGLVPVLASYLEDWSEQHGIPVQYETVGLETVRLAPNAEIAIFRIVQEALTNILKHAQASHVSVVLGYSQERVFAIVEDNGRGFDNQPAQFNKQTFGLTGMRERAELAGGTFDIESDGSSGTTVFVHIPGRTRTLT